MKIAVLMSTYNGETYLREQIDSILAQEGDFTVQLWVRDDGSSDGTLALLRAYESRGQLRWYAGENLGPAKSFLDLVQHCPGYDYYAFADQDDFWLPHKLSAAVEALEGNRDAWLYFSNAALVDASLRSLGRNTYRQHPRLDFCTLSCAGGILGCTTVFRRALAEAVQSRPMPEKLVMHDFYLDELCLALGGNILFDERPSMQYRQHGANVVGVSVGVLGKIRGRMRDITKKQKVSIAEQAATVLALYGSELSEDKAAWLRRVSVYRESIWRRCALALSPRTRYINWNMGLKLRLSILLGNR